MNSNNISNSGDGNVFNQNIGAQNISSIFGIDDLAAEWLHRKNNVANARRSRIMRSSVKLVLAIILLAVCLVIVKLSGGFDSLDGFIDFLRDLSVNVILTLISFIASVALGMFGWQGISEKSEREKRNEAGMKSIEERVEDLGFSKREWKKARRKVE